MDRSSCDVCALWAFAIGRSPRDHPGKTLTLRDSLARSAGSASTTSSCSVKRTCAGSSAPMLPTIMSRGPIDLWTRTPRSIAPFSAAAPSHHNLSSADFITNIAESDFWYTQAYFEETKIPHIKPGASAEIYLMDGSPALQGTVLGAAPSASRSGKIVVGLGRTPQPSRRT